MRWTAAVFAAVLWSGEALAQPLATDPTQSLDAAAFAPRPADADPALGLLDRQAYQPGAGPVQWRNGQTELSRSHGKVDSLRVSVGGPLVTPGGLPTGLDRAQFDARDYEVMVTRTWPAAARVGLGGLDLDVTPHAGVGVTSSGGSAQAGAMLRLGKALRDNERRRFYLFAEATGRAVDGGWNPTAPPTESSNTLIGDRRVGLGWTKGGAQASLGYMRRKVRGAHWAYGQEMKNDSLLAFSLSIRPQK